jgi:hypothetical protein
VLQRTVEIEYMEDNAACALIITTGKNPSLRHVLRTQKVDIKWLHEVFQKHKNLTMTLTPTKEQSADIFTKRFKSPREWLWACYNIGIDLSECLGSQVMLKSLIADSLLPKVTKSMKKAAAEAAAGGACAPPPSVPNGAPLRIERRKGKSGHCMFCCTHNYENDGGIQDGRYGAVTDGGIKYKYISPNTNHISASSSHIDPLIGVRSSPK